ncbi:XRE family transcriptional regulator, partial [Streptomyces sp. NPDC090025]
MEDRDDALTRFASGLRQLRRTAGSPPYRKLAALANYSSTTLADAAGGHKLPSLDVTLAYVRACHGDAVEWEARWRDAAAEIAADPAPAEPSAVDDGSCPYAGLSAFQPEDADRYFGRERLTEEIVSRVRTSRFLAVFGASGSGKSSLLRAGLLGSGSSGRSAPEPWPWPALLLTPGAHPLEECATHLAKLSNRSATEVHTELRDNPRALHLNVLQALHEHPAEADLLIVVDQFEEAFTQCAGERERSGFITQLLTAVQAANSRTRVVLGVRADFYSRCSEQPALVEALRDAQLLIGPMNTEELRRAISLPATRSGATVEGALLARVIADAAGQTGVLPLVSHALRETWHRRRGTTLTVAGYEAVGGITHALARTADHVYDQLAEPQRELVRGLFLRLVAPGSDGDRDTKRRVPRADLGAHAAMNSVLETLAQARLITMDATTVEITHEALLDAWPRLRRWIDEDRAGLLTYQDLAIAATTWHRDGRDPSGHYRGNRLANALEWTRRHQNGVQLDKHVTEFLDASGRHERRARRTGRAAVAALCVLTVLAATIAVVADRQRADALRQRDTTIAAGLTTQAQQMREADPALAAQLDLAAYRIRASPQAATALVNTGNAPLPVTVATNAGYSGVLSFSPDGHTLATADSNGDTAQLWQVGGSGRPTQVVGHTSSISSATFSPDGRTLVTASTDFTARLWNIKDPTRPTALARPLHHGGGRAVDATAFSPDGRILATAATDRIQLWNVRDPAHPALFSPLPTHEWCVSLTFRPDGRTLATAGWDQTVRLWNTADPAHPTPLGP